MAFTVNFYTFNKRENSTNRPSGAGRAFSCILKESSSVANPSIIVDIGTDTAPLYNYAYIAEYNRYYYVTEWTWTNNRLWAASLSTDLLATFRDQIGSSTCYVLRSSADYDGTVPDNYYPCKAASNFNVIQQATPFTFNAQSGSYVVSIASGLHPTYGTTTYYLLDAAQLDALMTALNNDIVTTLHDFTDADASFALQKALIDPFQYVTGCFWYPIAYADMPGLGAPVTITAGGFPLDNASGVRINASTPIKHFSMSFDLPNHPQIMRGAYLNATHRKLFLEIPPFGTCELDGSIACMYSKIIVDIGVDCISGMATIRIGSGNGATIEQLLERYETRVGVPMQLSNISSNPLGAIGGVGNMLIGMTGATMLGSAMGVINSIASGVGNMAQNVKPHMQSVGGTGSFASLTNTVPQGTPTSYTVQAKLYVQFLMLVDEDLDHCGRPLCQLRRLSSIPGYQLIKDGEIDINGFDGEAEAVRAYLENGYFYG